jgi:RHS repeat-associated protein
MSLDGAAAPATIPTILERNRANLSSPSWSCTQAAILTLLVSLVLVSYTAKSALAASYNAASWGPNQGGELGVGLLEGPEKCIEEKPCSKVATELKLTGISEEVVAVAAGNEHSLALLKNGKVLAWGKNERGDVGIPESEGNISTPREVAGLSEVTAIADDGVFSLALLKNGTVKAWGINSEGQLGNGTTSTESSEPVTVSGLTEVTAIAAGFNFGLALLKNGTVKAWGENYTGELAASESVEFSDVPLSISGLSEVVAIAAGAEAAFAVLKNGTVKAWGLNTGGELGDGTFTGPESCFGVACSRVPVSVSGLSEVTAVSSSYDSVLALIKNGTVKSWGENQEGELGNGTTENSDVPVSVSKLSGVTAVAAGLFQSLALLSNGTVEDWGDNEYGQLGTGTYTGPEECGAKHFPCSTTPVAVHGLAGVKGISANGISLTYGSSATALKPAPEEQLGPENPGDPNLEWGCFEEWESECTEEPFNTATGNESLQQTDVNVGGRGLGLKLTRTYNDQAAVTQPSPGRFGYGWSSSFSDHVVLNAEQKLLTVAQATGSVVIFSGTPGSVGEFSAPPQAQAKLSFNSEKVYVYTLPTQEVFDFNEEGRLINETDRNGNTTSFTYNGLGQLETVTDPAGRKLTFAYNGEGEVESVKDPMGHTVKYTYEGGNLASVTLPGESKPNWQFKYDSKHRLTSITDGREGKTTIEYDSSNRVVSETDAAGRKRKYVYAPSETTTTNEATGAVTREVFTAGDEREVVTRGYGTTDATSERFTYDSKGDMLSQTNGNGQATTYTYNEAGDKTSTNDPDKNETKWTYDSTHDVLTMTMPSGETTTTERDSHGNAIKISRPAPSETTQITKYTYNSHGDVESMTDPLERTSKYEYDSYGDRTAETDPAGDKRTWSYNEDSQAVSTTSPRGNASGAPASAYTTTTERDAQGRQVAVTEPSREPSYSSAFGSGGSGNGQFQFPTLEALDSSGNLWVVDSTLDRLQEFNEKGEYVTQFGSVGAGAGQFKFPFGVAINKSTGNIYVSDRENFRVQEFSSTGTFIRMFGYGVSDGAEKFEVCTSSCRAGVKGGKAGQFTFPDGVAIDSSGNVWIADEGNARLEKFSENGEYLNQYGTLGSGNGQLHQPVGLAYDNGNLYVAEATNERVQEFSTAGAYVSKFGSEGTGNGQFKIPYAIAAGPTTNDLYVTDRENNRVEIFTASGQFLSSFGSKGKGNAQMELPTGVVATASETLYVSDHLNKRVQNWTGLTPRVTKYAYDANGNVESLTDPNGNKTKYTYDADNERTKIEAANGAITETEYDGAGQVVSQTDANKHTTKYVRNILEQVTETIDPLARKTTEEYDAVGNLTSLTDPAARITTYKYDPANRLTEVSYSDGKTPAVKYEYDVNGNRTKMTDGTGTITYTYDQIDRLTESKDGHGDATKYAYDLANEQTKITYPNGKTVERTYDKAGRLEKVTDWLEHTTKFSYNADSGLTTTVFPTSTGEEDTYTYDLSGAMTEAKMLKGTETVASLLYARDSNSQVNRTIDKALPGSEIVETAYDPNNRLTKAGTTAYEYDAANNSTTIGSGTYKYDAASELETGPSVKYTYNEVGERTKTIPTTGPATTYGYDQADNLTTVERPAEGATPKIEDTYAYNGDGIRASETITGTTHYLSWDTSEKLPLLLNDGTNNYIYGPGGGPIEQINSEEKPQYLHHDQQGSIRLITGSTGTVEGAYTYTPYGGIEAHTGAATTALGYDAQYTSSDTGLIYLRARVYDPATAQFLSVDPAVETTLAPYSYAGDNPLTKADPGGECAASARIATASSAADDCKKLMGEIERTVRELKKRLRDLLEDRKKLPLKEVKGHIKAFKQKQRRLEKYLRQWNRENCSEEIGETPQVAEGWALVKVEVQIRIVPVP